jgi:hypothetical protein
VEVVAAGSGHLELAGHDGLGTLALKVVDETEVRRSGRGLREEGGGVWVGCGDGVVDDVAFAVEIEREERGVVHGKTVRVGEDGELVAVGAVEVFGALAGVG